MVFPCLLNATGKWGLKEIVRVHDCSMEGAQALNARLLGSILSKHHDRSDSSAASSPQKDVRSFLKGKKIVPE